MQRRQFLGVFGGAVLAPLVARAQPRSRPVVGFLRDTAADGTDFLVKAVQGGLREAGLTEGRDFELAFGWGEGRRERLPMVAADLVRLPASVIIASATAATMAAKAVTSSVPVVFAFPGDPIERKLVASINRPGGNMTGVSYLNTELAGKRLGLLHELLPPVSTVAVLVNPNGTNGASTVQDVRAVLPAIGVTARIFNATNAQEIDAAFAALHEQKIGALLVGNDSFFTTRGEQICALAARYGVPAVYAQREFADGGGLLSYGTNLSDAYRLAGLYAGRILKGEKPADLPVLQPTKFEMVLNLKAAKALDLAVPATILALADEVIE